MDLGMIREDIIYSESEKYSYNNQYVPRVNDILSAMLHEENLMSWSNYMGLCNKNYKTIMNNASIIGEKTHKYIESIINGNIIDLSSEPYPEVCIAVNSFTDWFNIVLGSNNKINTIYTEKSLSCPYYGGTIDWVVEINDIPYIVDFKTSKHITYKYIIQLAAYRQLLYLNDNREINNFIILKLSKDKIPSFEEVIINDINIINLAQNTFNGLMYSYFNRMRLKDMIKSQYDISY